MKKLLILATLLFSSPAIAGEAYRPFRYETPCLIESGIQTYPDTCVVIETREKNGSLRTRNIFSNKHSLTIKGRFDKEQGYMTWDSHNKYEYKWEYKLSGNEEYGSWTMVMPGVLVQNISWD
jgi:hypothetical protein